MSAPSHEPHKRTEKLLVLWLDLQEAVAQFRRGRARTVGLLVKPWECNDDLIVRLWRQITHPDNLSALDRWLHQVGDPQSEQWALEALRQCRERAGAARVNS